MSNKKKIHISHIRVFTEEEGVLASSKTKSLCSTKDRFYQTPHKIFTHTNDASPHFKLIPDTNNNNDTTTKINCTACCPTCISSADHPANTAQDRDKSTSSH